MSVANATASDDRDILVSMTVLEWGVWIVVGSALLVGTCALALSIRRRARISRILPDGIVQMPDGTYVGVIVDAERTATATTLRRRAQTAPVGAAVQQQVRTIVLTRPYRKQRTRWLYLQTSPDCMDDPIVDA